MLVVGILTEPGDDAPWWLGLLYVAWSITGGIVLNHLLVKRDLRRDDIRMRDLVQFLRIRSFNTNPLVYGLTQNVTEVIDTVPPLQRNVDMSDHLLFQLQLAAADYEDDPEYNPKWKLS